MGDTMMRIYRLPIINSVTFEHFLPQLFGLIKPDRLQAAIHLLDHDGPSQHESPQLDSYVVHVEEKMHEI